MPQSTDTCEGPQFQVHAGRANSQSTFLVTLTDGPAGAASVMLVLVDANAKASISGRFSNEDPRSVNLSADDRWGTLLVSHVQPKWGNILWMGEILHHL